VCTLAELRRVKDYVVVVEVETKRDVQFFADRKQVVYGPGYVVIFEDEARFDGW